MGLPISSSGGILPLRLLHPRHLDIVDSLGYPGGNSSSRAYGISADGKVVVGYSKRERADPTAIPEAFRWTEGGGMQPIGTLGSRYSDAIAVSSDGLSEKHRMDGCVRFTYDAELYVGK